MCKTNNWCRYYLHYTNTHHPIAIEGEFSRCIWRWWYRTQSLFTFPMPFTMSNYMRRREGEIIWYSKHTAWLRKTVIQSSERRSGWVRHRSPTLLQTRHMSIMASQITGHVSVCSTICSGQHQRHMKAPRYWPFVRGIHRWPLNSRTKGQWRGNASIWWRQPAPERCPGDRVAQTATKYV